MPHDGIDYYQLISSLDIQEALIPKALDSQQYQDLYHRLTAFQRGWIKEDWQVSAIAGEQSAYDNLNQRDHGQANKGHYAALSGNTWALTRVLKKKTLSFF